MHRIPKPKVGFKLADFNKLFGIASNGQRPLLLKSRTQQRYKNLSQSDLELLTVVSGVYSRENRDALNLLLQRRPNLAQEKYRQSVMQRIMAAYSVSERQLKAWTSCFLAPDLDQALTAMADEQWPAFLLLHAFNRPIQSRRTAHQLLILYQDHLALIPSQYQPELCWLALEVAQRHLIEYLEPVVRLYLKLCDTSNLNSMALNELLWKLARYGTLWSNSDLQVIKTAQQRLVTALGTEKLDSKGFIALAYVAHFESRALALQIIEGMPSEDNNDASSARNDIPYTYGKTLIRLRCCTSFEDGLVILNSISKPDRKPIVWEAFLQGLVSAGTFDNDDETLLKLWKYWKNNGIRPSSQMTCLVLRKMRSFHFRQGILNEFLALPSINLSSALLKSMLAPVDTYDEYVLLKEFITPLGKLAPAAQEALLYLQSHWEPQLAWETYQSIPGDKSCDAVAFICQAAHKADMWGDAWAAQRALVEVKRWIQQDREDYFKSYPSELLVHSYIVMLGRGDYQEELDRVLTWLKTIGFTPTKRILCALIVYSQYGQTLQKLATKSDQWPTEQEVELYRLDG